MNIFKLFKRASPDSLGKDHAITGTVNLTAQLAGSSGRTIAVSSYIYDGESKESLEDRLDILQEVIERQRTRCEIPELEAKRDQMLQGMQQARDVMGALETKQKNGESLSSQEKMNLRNLSTNLEKMNEEIEKGTAAIKDAKKKAGVGG